MARKRTLNERRLTRRQVQELISSGARSRPDLAAVFESTLPQPRVYELEADRYLFVFGEQVSGRGAKGDIYSGDDFRRFVRWTAKVDADTKHGRQGAVRHWAYYSSVGHRLTANIDTLLAQLRSTTARDLDFSYESLDLISEYVECIGLERAQREIYDHLVAYVGEVLRLRIQGHWEVRTDDEQPYPYLVAAKHDPVMPINVVWQELGGLTRVDLRTAAANEVRRTRKPRWHISDAATSIRAAAPRGVLATLSADDYEVKTRWADGHPWIVAFKRDVEIVGIPCRGEAGFGRNGDLIGATLSREWVLGTRRFAANSSFRFYARREDGRLNDVKLGADQEIDGLPCRGETVVWFHANQRISSVHLAGDREVDGIPCAGGKDAHLSLNFHPNGRLAAAVLAREHVLIGRTFPRGAYLSFDRKGHLVGVALAEDREIDGIPVKAGVPVLAFHDNGRVRELTLARSHSFSGTRCDRGTLLRFDRDGRLTYVQP